MIQIKFSYQADTRNGHNKHTANRNTALAYGLTAAISIQKVQRTKT